MSKRHKNLKTKLGIGFFIVKWIWACLVSTDIVLYAVCIYLRKRIWRDHFLGDPRDLVIMTVYRISCGEKSFKTSNLKLNINDT